MSTYLSSQTAWTSEHSTFDKALHPSPEVAALVSVSLVPLKTIAAPDLHDAALFAGDARE